MLMLEELKLHVSESSNIIINEMLAMHLHSTGQFEASQNNKEIALDYYYLSVSMFEEILLRGGNIYHSIGPSISLGSELCSNRSEEKGNTITY